MLFDWLIAHSSYLVVVGWQAGAGPAWRDAIAYALRAPLETHAEYS